MTKGECAARQTVLAVFIEREDLHGNVARVGILLQVIQDCPAQHVGQEDVERNGRRVKFTRQCQGLGAV